MTSRGGGNGQGHSKVLDACQMHSDGSRQRSSPGSGLGYWQEIEAEVWLEKRAACSDHQTPGLSGKMNSRLFTLLSIPAPSSLNDTKGSRVVSIIGQGRQGL